MASLIKSKYDDDSAPETPPASPWPFDEKNEADAKSADEEPTSRGS